MSSDRQAEEGYSIPAQVQRLHEYAARQGMTIAAEFVASESAKGAGRKVFQACVASLRGKDAPRILLVEKADRATRNFQDFLTLEELRQEGLKSTAPARASSSRATAIPRSS